MVSFVRFRFRFQECERKAALINAHLRAETACGRLILHPARVSDFHYFNFVLAWKMKCGTASDLMP